MLAMIMEYLTLENMKIAGVTVGSLVIFYGLWKIARLTFGLGKGVLSLAGKTKGAWSHLYVPGALMGAGLSVDYALANPEYFWTAIGGGISGLTMAWDGLRSRGWFGGHGVGVFRANAIERKQELERNAFRHRNALEALKPNAEESTGGRH